ncbi:MAG TPA: hypothetical protein K8V47_01680 [Candidatus Amulumruptor caecigallinarius]|uniref:PorZ N-terminal beta-propeller domain-containing protein n=1 Tax=Candidatus Amulumruptor caecigallinarius TaxID=2109911 RepID=A0A921E7N2_9BACT|nr:hypothetical protein [Candidatus Amulumruptor caecigallinarius]
MKYSRSLILFLSIVAVTLSVSAQKLAGEWKKYQVIKPYIQRVISTPDRLYYICTDRLFSYDASTKQSDVISEGEGLTIGDISTVKYNHDKGYLALGAYDGSLGLVYDDGRVLNVQSVKNMSVASSKSIRDIDFLGDDVYLATDFGLVIIDASEGTVKNYTRPASDAKTGKQSFTAVVAVPGYVLGVSGGVLYCIPSDNRMRNFSNLKSLGLTLGNVELYGRGDGTFYASTYPDNCNTSSTKYMRLYRFDHASAACTLVNDYSITPISHIWEKGNVYMVEVEEDGGVATYDISSESDAEKLESTATPWMATDYSYDPVSKNKIISTYQKVNFYDGNGNNTGSFVADVPDDYTNVEAISIMYPSFDRRRIYLSTRSSSYNWKTAGNNYNPELYTRRPLPAFNGWIASMQSVDEVGSSDAYGFFVPSYVNMVSDGNVSDVSNYDPSNHYGNKNKVNQDNGGYWIYFLQAYYALGNLTSGGEGLAENPKKPGQYWHATNAEGLYVMEGGKELRILSNETSTMKSRNQWGTQILDVKFDKEGNVWILTPTVNRADASNWPVKLDSSVLQMLPASKAADVASITADDWIEANKLPVGTAEDSGQIDGRLTVTVNRMANGGESEYIFIKPLVYHGKILVYRRNSQGGEVDKDYPLFITSIKDQNGNEYLIQEMTHIEEDSQGRVWMGNLSFFGYFDSKTELPEGTTTLPIIVPYDRKRGGSPVDHAFITGISQSPVDGTLWVASQGNGLFHLNAEGTEQLENFRTSNSILTTDILGSVCVDASGDVYIGSQKGLFRYRPAYGAAAGDLSAVKVDPAVAKDGYNGAFTITDLTESCSVKVKDAEGNLLFEGISHGGTLIWDGIDKNGNRINTGVYDIVAGASGQTVAKIIVME